MANKRCECHGKLLREKTQLCFFIKVVCINLIGKLVLMSVSFLFSVIGTNKVGLSFIVIREI